MPAFPIIIQFQPEPPIMVDPQKLTAFDSTITNLRIATDKATASNSDAVDAAKTAADKAAVATSDFTALQVDLDTAIAAGVAIGLKVNLPDAPVAAAVPAA